MTEIIIHLDDGSVIDYDEGTGTVAAQIVQALEGLDSREQDSVVEIEVAK